MSDNNNNIKLYRSTSTSYSQKHIMFFSIFNGLESEIQGLERVVSYQLDKLMMCLSVCFCTFRKRKKRPESLTNSCASNTRVCSNHSDILSHVILFTSLHLPLSHLLSLFHSGPKSEREDQMIGPTIKEALCLTSSTAAHTRTSIHPSTTETNKTCTTRFFLGIF